MVELTVEVLDPRTILFPAGFAIPLKSKRIRSGKWIQLRNPALKWGGLPSPLEPSLRAHPFGRRDYGKIPCARNNMRMRLQYSVI